MSAKPKVAIVTRTKDRPLFLKRALESVAAQTFTDYVHVIVNDGGDKKDVDDLVAGLFAEQQAKTKVFHRAKASNAPDTIFNESIDRVDSEYFAIHDDDDTWHKDFLAETVQQLDENGELGAVVARADKIVEAVNGQNIVEKKRSHYMPDMRAISLYRQCIDNQLTPIATLFRRSAYQAVGKFDDSLPVVGDWEFGIRLLLKYDVDYIDPGHALASYHHRTGDNSFLANDHRKYITKVHNQYLRQELSEGKLGVGYIMNDLRYKQDMITATARKLLPGPLAKVVRRKVR